MTRSLSVPRPMRTVRAGSGRTVVGARKVPVADGIETADGRSAHPRRPFRPTSTARGPSAGLPNRMTVPGPTPHSWIRLPSAYVPFVLSSSSIVQWPSSGRSTAWCQDTRASSMTMSLKGSRPT